MSKVKKFLPGTAIVVSSYISILFAAGLIVGYFTTKYFYNKTVEKGRLKSVFLNFGKWRIHIHHWLMGVLIFFSVWAFGWLGSLPVFFIGTIFGLILHDLYFDEGWYKVVLRKQEI